VQSSDDTGILHDSDIITTLQAWVIAMSSSVLRSFRHTATAVALETQTALCQITAATDAEVEMIRRQREGERKKKGKGGTSGREKDLEKKAKEVNTKRSQLTEYIKEFFDGFVFQIPISTLSQPFHRVFIHRYRDLDPAIRADCVQALGKWIITHSTHFLDSGYLRYIGWVLSDPVNSVRLASVKALATLYVKKDYAVSLGHFTDRFKKRMVEIACRDTDLSIRVAIIGLLSNIEQLEDDERDKICLLVFDGEAKVRKAVSGFVKDVWEEAFEDKMVGLGSNEVTRQRVGIKCLASLLVKWTQILDSGDDNESQSQSQADAWQRPKEVGWLVSGSPNETRVAMVVDALADEVDAVSEWQPLLDNLLLDHSATEETTTRKSKKGKAAKAPSSASDDSVDDAWRLDEVEEGIMLEVFVAALAKLCSSTGSNPGKKVSDSA
jgi:cohesin complex subunit SA-1/2